jgi:ribosomal-protein-alanine N-acetyltransferase
MAHGLAAELTPAGIADAEALAALQAQALPEPWPATEIARWLAKSAVTALLARSEGRAIGFVLAQRAADEAEILSLAVARDARRRGVASGLLDRLEIVLAECGVVLLHLEVAADNTAARALYAGRGYLETARRRGYYVRHGAPPVDAVMMVKRLEAHPGGLSRSHLR